MAEKRVQRVLLALGDDYFRGALSRVLREEGYEVEETGDGSLAQDLLGMEFYDLIICGEKLARVESSVATREKVFDSFM